MSWIDIWNERECANMWARLSFLYHTSIFAIKFVSIKFNWTKMKITFAAGFFSDSVQLGFYFIQIVNWCQWHEQLNIQQSRKKTIHCLRVDRLTLADGSAYLNLDFLTGPLAVDDGVAAISSCDSGGSEIRIPIEKINSRQKRYYYAIPLVRRASISDSVFSMIFCCAGVKTGIRLEFFPEPDATGGVAAAATTSGIFHLK